MSLAEAKQRDDDGSLGVAVDFRRNVDGDGHPIEFVLRQRRVLRCIGAQCQRETLRAHLLIDQEFCHLSIDYFTVQLMYKLEGSVEFLPQPNAVQHRRGCSEFLLQSLDSSAPAAWLASATIHQFTS